MSCDTKPVNGLGELIDPDYYLGFWEPVSKAWKKLGIEPILLKVVENPSDFTDGNGVYHLPVIKDLPDYTYQKSVRNFQSMTARLWGWSMFEGNGIITDLDMMPLNGNYFNGQNYSEDKVVSFSSDAKEKFGTIGACYVLSNHKKAREFFGEIDYSTWIKKVALMTGQKWGGEQWYLEQLVNFADGIHLSRGFNSAGEASRRIDRNSWNYTEEQVKKGYYFDAHLPRPYKEYKETIYKLLSLI